MDYTFLLELSAGCGLAAYTLHKVTDYLKVKANANARMQLNRPVQGVPAISALIENIDTIIDEQHKLRQKQIEAGATPESLKPLDVQIARLEWVQKNKSWLQYVSPYADQIAQWGMKLLVKIAR